MQDEQFNPDAPGKLPGESGRAQASQPDDGGWADIARRIERQLRSDVARLVGAPGSDDWGTIKQTLTERVRGQAESVDSTEIGRQVKEIGRQVENQVRSGLADATGAGRDADWSIIGQTLRERVEQLLDPGKSPYPGGSGTGAAADDASVPAAPPSADNPPVPPRAGGEDSGLPTVTDDVDRTPSSPPAERQRPDLPL